jgi:hypothetical protein
MLTATERLVILGLAGRQPQHAEMVALSRRDVISVACAIDNLIRTKRLDACARPVPLAIAEAETEY